MAMANHASRVVVTSTVPAGFAPLARALCRLVRPLSPQALLPGPLLTDPHTDARPHTQVVCTTWPAANGCLCSQLAAHLGSGARVLLIAASAL